MYISYIYTHTYMHTYTNAYTGLKKWATLTWLSLVGRTAITTRRSPSPD